MPRPKWSKDKKPRKMNPNSLAALPNTSVPGCESASLRIYAPKDDVRWFERKTPVERGKIVTKANPKTKP